MRGVPMQFCCNLGVLGSDPRIHLQGCTCAMQIEVSRRSSGGRFAVRSYPPVLRGWVVEPPAFTVPVNTALLGAFLTRVHTVLGCLVHISVIFGWECV